MSIVQETKDFRKKTGEAVGDQHRVFSADKRAYQKHELWKDCDIEKRWNYDVAHFGTFTLHDTEAKSSNAFGKDGDPKFYNTQAEIQFRVKTECTPAEKPVKAKELKEKPEGLETPPKRGTKPEPEKATPETSTQPTLQ